MHAIALRAARISLVEQLTSSSRGAAGADGDLPTSLEAREAKHNKFLKTKSMNGTALAQHVLGTTCVSTTYYERY